MNFRYRSIILWLLPLFTSLAIQGISFGWNRVVFSNAIENLLTVLILISVLLLVKTKLAKLLSPAFYVLWTLSCLVESIYYYVFKSNLSASSIYILLETNLAESKEFVEFYLNPSIVLMIVGFLIFILLFLLKKRTLKDNHFSFIHKIGIAMVPILSACFLLISGFIKYNFVALTLKSVKDYVYEYKKIDSFGIDKSIAEIENFQFQEKYEKATFVFVLGESTTRNRLSLYGYSRNTTPYLKSIENELLVYTDVISPNAYTIGSLRKILTANGLNNDDDFSIIQLMNQAGFKTFWLSNQRPIGKYESLITKIASASDVYQIKNTSVDGSITPYDEVLLPLIDDALKDKANLKFIVIHPLGTHMQYMDRYPKDFDKFKGKSTSSFNNYRAHELSNAYDNALLYHDSFLENIHKQLKALEEPSYMIYFSDHGEEVFTDIDFAGHTDDNPTAPMYEVPYFLWMNSSFQDLSKIIFDAERPYNLTDFIHSFSELNSIQFKGFNSKKSIFSKDFKPKKRIISNGIDFDLYFERQKDSMN